MSIWKVIRDKRKGIRQVKSESTSFSLSLKEGLSSLWVVKSLSCPSERRSGIFEGEGGLYRDLLSGKLRNWGTQYRPSPGDESFLRSLPVTTRAAAYLAGTLHTWDPLRSLRTKCEEESNKSRISRPVRIPFPRDRLNRQAVAAGNWGFPSGKNEEVSNQNSQVRIQSGIP